MKRKITAVITAVLASPLLCAVTGINTEHSAYINSITAYAEEVTAGIYTTYGVDDFLNIRSSPDTSSTVLGTIPAGAQFSAEAPVNGWAYASYNGITGYVSAQYIQLLSQENRQTGFYTTYGVTSSLNIRQSADGSSSVIGGIPAGGEFYVSGFEGSWASVVYNGISGYVSTELIQFVREGTPELKIVNAEYPEWFVPAGFSTLSGTLSPAGSITHIQGVVTDNDTGAAVLSAEVQPSGSEYDISGLISSGLDISSLGVGSYTLTLTAADSSGNAAELLRTDFTVAGSESDYDYISAGDANGDKQVNTADLVMLGRYLLGAGGMELNNCLNTDLNRDMRIDSFDLTMLRRLVIEEIERQNNAGKPVMLDVIEYDQHPDYPTGCESVALYMLLRYYGTSVTVEDIVEALPKGPLPYWSGGMMYGANPEREFVGDPRNDYSYGVFNKPLAQTAEKFRSGAITTTGASTDDIISLLDRGIPVLAWYTTKPDRGIQYLVSWSDYLTGETVNWPSGEHAIVVCGHDGTSLTYRDPNTGGSNTLTTAQFSITFDELGGRILYYEK
ncbi:MAG: C39 family peptidase [Ruminococcus sp.]|nr:C39 family peptidase [Ruminococcus sp.]